MCSTRVQSCISLYVLGVCWVILCRKGELILCFYVLYILIWSQVSNADSYQNNVSISLWKSYFRFMIYYLNIWLTFYVAEITFNQSQYLPTRFFGSRYCDIFIRDLLDLKLATHRRLLAQSTKLLKFHSMSFHHSGQMTCLYIINKLMLQARYTHMK